MFEGFKVYGPYLRKDGRKHVVLVDRVTKKKTTMSWPKYFYQNYHNILLSNDDTIDHIDRDFTNDSIDNLVVRSREEHGSIDARRTKLSKAICQWCFNEFERRANQLTHCSNLGKAGPFCGKSCAGKYGASVQNGGKILPVQPRIEIEDREYYFIDKSPCVGI